jgi:hypothetical protein
MFYYNQQMHNYIIKVYITTVSMCNPHSYMFRLFRVIIDNKIFSLTISNNMHIEIFMYFFIVLVRNMCYNNCYYYHVINTL